MIKEYHNKIIFASGFKKMKLINQLIKLSVLSALIIPSSKKYKDKYLETVNLCKKNKIIIMYYSKSKLFDISSKPLKFNFNDKFLYSSGFPFILPIAILNKFKTAINLHPVDLPDFPGRNLHNAILSNRKKLNATLHYMDAGADSGEIIMKLRYERGHFDSIDSITRKASDVEIKNIVKILDKIFKFEKKAVNINLSVNNYKQKVPADSEIALNTRLDQAIKFIGTSDEKLYPTFFMYKGRKVFVYMKSEKKAHKDEV